MNSAGFIRGEAKRSAITGGAMTPDCRTRAATGMAANVHRGDTSPKMVAPNTAPVRCFRKTLSRRARGNR